jgi:hypothetical protein
MPRTRKLSSVAVSSRSPMPRMKSQRDKIGRGSSLAMQKQKERCIGLPPPNYAMRNEYSFCPQSITS